MHKHIQIFTSTYTLCTSHVPNYVHRYAVTLTVTSPCTRTEIRGNDNDLPQVVWLIYPPSCCWWISFGS